ncbi:MAG TPA: Hsp20 family protein [Candidatus Binataceae bacterium]|nr:Hsp20 family protein [Candidatus Binataceae bacterium]
MAGSLIFGDFERAIDAFFDEMLVDRWKCGAASGFEHTELSDLPDRYEIRLASRGVETGTIEVESRGQRLTVRASAGQFGRLESGFAFAENVEPESATAAWSNGVLTVIVPKNKARRIALKAQ